MRVIFTKETKDDFRKHRDFVRRQTKSDGHKYQPYELDDISKAFKKNLRKNLENITEPKDSIFPEKFEYNSKSHKMYVDKESHYIVFYTVETSKKGNQVIKVRKNIHFTELQKELKERDVKPLKNYDIELKRDILIVDKEIKVKNGSITDEEKKKYNEQIEKLEDVISKRKKKHNEERLKELDREESQKDTDSKSGEKKDSDEDSKSTKEDPRKIWKRRPRKDGHGSTKNYYNVHNPESSISQEQRDELVKNYKEANESVKPIQVFIRESNIVSLKDYLNKLVG